VWFRKPRPLPVYCRTCGCPMAKRWEHGYEHFDELTGLGTRTDQAVWACTNENEDARFHELFNIWRLKETRVVTVTSACNSK